MNAYIGLFYVAEKSVLNKKEIAFLQELKNQHIPFMVVGLTAAILQGAPLSTQDLDLWFKNLSDPRIADIIRKLGGFYVPPFPEFMNSPQFGGEGFSLIDPVLNMAGLHSFEKEYRKAKTVTVQGIKLKVLPLERVIHSKKEAGRPKDKMAMPALEATLKASKKKKS